jgi:uncharacterized protein (DUF983 family)
LYRRLLEVQPVCPHCGLDLAQSDSGDGGAALIIMVLGAIIVGLAFWTEFHFQPPLWVHAVLWPSLTIPLAILMIRTTKAGFIAMQFRHRASEMGL